MRLNRANRAFFVLVGVAFLAYNLLGAGACALFSVIVYRFSTEGFAFVSANPWGLAGLTVFVSLYALGWIFALLSVRRQIVATMRLSRRVRRLRLPKTPALAEAEGRARLGGRVDLVDADEAFSFAYGILSPRVAVSRGLVGATSEAELDAVLAHERYHLRNWDPVKVVIARALPAAFFYLPVLNDLKARYIEGRELAADRRALRAHGEAPLAGALYKVVKGPLWSELGAAAAIGGPELLEARVGQLETGREPPGEQIALASWIATAVGAVALALSFGVAIGSFGLPLDAMRGGMMAERDMHGGGFLSGVAFWALVVGGAWFVYRRTRRRRSGA